MSTIQVRIDKKTKRDAQRVLNSLGLDMSTAIKAYFKQICIRQGLPFQLTTENGLTLAEEAAILKASREAKKGKNVTPYMNPKKAIEYLDSL